MRSKAFIFMKFAENGPLDTWMDKNGGRLKEQQANKFFYGLMCGLNYLHQLNIAHRDLKLDNFLLDENLEPMITDFGFSVLSNSPEEYRIMRNTLCGTNLYLAPEVRIMSKTGYDAKKSDIYSMGMSKWGFPA